MNGMDYRWGDTFTRDTNASTSPVKTLTSVEPLSSRDPYQKVIPVRDTITYRGPLWRSPLRQSLLRILFTPFCLSSKTDFRELPTERTTLTSVFHWNRVGKIPPPIPHQSLRPKVKRKGTVVKRKKWTERPLYNEICKEGNEFTIFKGCTKSWYFLYIPVYQEAIVSLTQVHPNKTNTRDHYLSGPFYRR